MSDENQLIDGKKLSRWKTETTNQYLCYENLHEFTQGVSIAYVGCQV